MKNVTIYFDEFDLELTYLIGQNAKDNFAVIDKGFEDDIWFHAKLESSCHVVCLLPNNFKMDKKIQKSILEKGAELCKKNTCKLSNLHKTEFIYTELKNVTKTKTPGLVITKNTKSINI